MVQYKANKPQQYIKILKKAIIKAKELKIPKVIKLAVQGAKAKPKILIKEDI